MASGHAGDPYDPALAHGTDGVTENARSPYVDPQFTYPPYRVAVFTKHYPSPVRPYAGIFVRKWCLSLTGKVFVNSHADKADLMVAHWLWPAGFKALWYSLRYRKPLLVVLYGDPYMYERYWWVRLAAFPILWRACAIQVISTPCEDIMRRSIWGHKVRRVPVR